MTWQNYIYHHLLETRIITEACIAGIDGNIWGCSCGFGITQDELNRVIIGFNDKSELISKGLIIGGQKYFYLSGDYRLIRARLGCNGVHCVKTERAVIIAMYDTPIVPAEAAVVVENLGDHLVIKGF